LQPENNLLVQQYKSIKSESPQNTRQQKILQPQPQVKKLSLQTASSMA
jgi:hypothetical protein